jgi:hypothetical protein
VPALADADNARFAALMDRFVALLNRGGVAADDIDPLIDALLRDGIADAEALLERWAAAALPTMESAARSNASRAAQLEAEANRLAAAGDDRTALACRKSARPYRDDADRLRRHAREMRLAAVRSHAPTPRLLVRQLGRGRGMPRQRASRRVGGCTSRGSPRRSDDDPDDLGDRARRRGAR